MSKPANELAKYRSYSYYHVLAMCDSSQTAIELSGQTSLDVWQHATAAEVADGTSITSRYAVKSLPSGGKYCILINGSTDATFTITNAKWTSYTAASATMNDRNTSNALEGNISISEPRGIVFLDTVVRCCFELGVDSANAFWALKTFFVGYTDQDTVEYINTVPPVIFLAYDVVGNFGVVGGEYEISFVAAANGAARLPHYSKSARATNIKAAGTFAGTLAVLEQDIQDNYDAYFACVHDQVAAMPGGSEIAESLRKVTYHIQCGPPYINADGSPNPKYKVTDQVAQSKDLAFCDDPSNIHVSSGVSIEDAIHRIIGMSKEIKAEASEGVSGVKYTTKIQTWVESKPGDKGLQFDVGYRVERQMQPRSVTFEQFSEGGELTPEMQKNVIEFDYIYTGKNIDITEFDIKMNMGMVYLQGMTIANPYKQPGDQTAITASAPSGMDLSGRATGKNIPVFFGTQIKTASIRDTTDIKTTSQNTYSMTKHASLEMLEATVKIAGNSQLLGCVNHTSSPENIKTSTRYESDEALAKFAEWGFAPSFAKINIKMPRNNDDIALFTGAQTGTESTQSTDYAVDFWFTGYYYVYGVEHVFDNGEFYQVLNALGIPEKNSFKVTQDKTQQRDADLSKNVESCYEHHIGCSGGTKNDGSSPPVESPGVFERALDKVTDTAKKAAGSVWEMAVDAGNRLGVHPDLILAQYGLESGWGKSMSGTNNPFGIKAKKGQDGTDVMTHEVENGVSVKKSQKFANYDSLSDAFVAHSSLLQNKRYSAVRAATTQEELASAIGKSGYATDPAYGQKIYKIMQSKKFKELKGSGEVAPATTPTTAPPPAPAPAKISETTPPVRKNRDMLASVNPCDSSKDENKEPTKPSTCSSLPSDSSQNNEKTTVASVDKTLTGQASVSPASINSKTNTLVCSADNVFVDRLLQEDVTKSLSTISGTPSSILTTLTNTKK